MLIIRIIHGCCVGITGTLIYSLTISLSKSSEVKKDLGYLEIGWCLGVIMGPMFASIFYKIGGYPLPFLILGSILYISVFLTSKVAQENTTSNIKMENDSPFLKFLKYKEVLFILGLFFIGYISQSFFYPCLTNHLKQNFNLSISISSLFFIIVEISYVTILQFLDYFTKKFGLYGTSCIGLLITSLGVLMIYPYPPIPKKLIFVILGFIFIGGGSVPIFIPGLIALNKNIKRIDPNIEELSAGDITSAINFFIINIGDFCGPIIGGFFSKYLGFKNCCLLISIIVFIYCILFFMFFKKFISYDIQNIASKKSSLDLQSEENELINHLGVYKSDSLNSFISARSFDLIGRRKSSFGLLLKDELDDYEYKSLDDNN
jgi:predicted MFS family arabinose efflux permease